MIYGIIPARGGSKGVPGKNIKLLNGYPLIAYAICASKLSKKIERTIVSTDSQQIADISVKYGAEVPFLRPSELAKDNSTDLELMQHMINWLKEKENKEPKLLVHLRPTTPLRDSSEIDRAIEYLQKNRDATSLRSAHELSEPPQKMFQIGDDGFFQGFFPEDPRPEYYNLARQVFPKAYHPNGYVDIIRPDFVNKTKTLHGLKILGFITALSAEVDLPEDFEYLQYLIGKSESPVYRYLVENFPKES